MTAVTDYAEIAAAFDTLEAIAGGDICGGCHDDSVELTYRDEYGVSLCDDCYAEAGQ